MKRIETYGQISNGVLKISYRDKFIEALKQLPDCRGRLIFEKLYKKRSKEQRGYYFAVIVAEFVNGWRDTQGEFISRDEAHTKLKEICNPIELINNKTGEIIKVAGSTKKFTTIEQEEYNERCRLFIYSWFNITVPLPNENLELPLTDKL
jgi:hypothetical protein